MVNEVLLHIYFYVVVTENYQLKIKYPQQKFKQSIRYGLVCLEVYVQ